MCRWYFSSKTGFLTITNRESERVHTYTTEKIHTAFLPIIFHFVSARMYSIPCVCVCVNVRCLWLFGEALCAYSGHHSLRTERVHVKREYAYSFETDCYRFHMVRYNVRLSEVLLTLGCFCRWIYCSYWFSCAVHTASQLTCHTASGWERGTKRSVEGVGGEGGRGVDSRKHIHCNAQSLDVAEIRYASHFHTWIGYNVFVSCIANCMKPNHEHDIGAWEIRTRAKETDNVCFLSLSIFACINGMPYSNFMQRTTGVHMM